MLRLLILVLALLGAAAAPAHPACAPAVTTAHHGHAPSEQAPPPHLCLGCAPAADWLRSPVAAPAATAAVPPVAVATALPAGRAPRPIPPPPRLG
jgi:hypothetical protein